MKEYVLVERSVYEDLLDSENFLIALQGAGVDNWDAYDIALEMSEHMDSGEDRLKKLPEFVEGFCTRRVVGLHDKKA